MLAERFVRLFQTDHRYRRWFRAWWKRDYSITALKLRGMDHPGYGSKVIEFAGREWWEGFLPPHDEHGTPNEAFEFVSASKLLREHEGRREYELVGLFVGPDISQFQNAYSIRMQDVFIGGALILGRRRVVLSLVLDRVFITGGIQCEVIECEFNFRRLVTNSVAITSVGTAGFTLDRSNIDDVILPTC